jgi:hypothetical protein
VIGRAGKLEGSVGNGSVSHQPIVKIDRYNQGKGGWQHPIVWLWWYLHYLAVAQFEVERAHVVYLQDGHADAV